MRCSSWDLHGADELLMVGWATSLCRYITEWNNGCEGASASEASRCGKYLERRGAGSGNNITDNEVKEEKEIIEYHIHPSILRN